MRIKKYLSKIKKYILFLNQYYYDYKFFKNNFSHSKINKTKTGYNICLIVHSLEKGLSNLKPRQFGQKKVKELINLIKIYEKYQDSNNDYEYKIAINSLYSYLKFYEDNKWTSEQEYKEVKEFLKTRKKYDDIEVGSHIIRKEDFINDAKINYDSFLSSRHSVRNFDKKELKESDIEKAVNIAIKSPTACNRQMCKIYYIKDKEKRNKVIEKGQGFGCFELDNVNIFVITFDVSANYFIGERNQGWFNSGLVSMNFVNALHSLGIGSCFIQFGNTVKQEEELKRILNIPKNERIAVIISAGYYAKESKIPYSSRKTIEDIYLTR